MCRDIGIVSSDGKMQPANPYIVEIVHREDGINLTWVPVNGPDALHGITGPVFFPKDKKVVAVPHSSGGIHVSTEATCTEVQ